MESPLSAHISTLETHLNRLTNEMMRADAKHVRTQLHAEIRAVALALAHCHAADQLESTLASLEHSQAA